jgi:hypothetical protein
MSRLVWANQTPETNWRGKRPGTGCVEGSRTRRQGCALSAPYLFGLAAGAAAGVTRVVEILRDQFKMAMALTGPRTLAEIDRSVIG